MINILKLPWKILNIGGMENTTCTTLTTSILPDEKTIRDSNTYDYGNRSRACSSVVW